MKSFKFIAYENCYIICKISFTIKKTIIIKSHKKIFVIFVSLLDSTIIHYNM